MYIEFSPEEVKQIREAVKTWEKAPHAEEMAACLFALTILPGDKASSIELIKASKDRAVRDVTERSVIAARLLVKFDEVLTRPSEFQAPVG